MKLDCTYKESGLPNLTRDKINNLAENVLHEYDPESLRVARALNVPRFIRDCLYIDLKTDTITQDGVVLGMMSFCDQKFPVWREDQGFLPIEVSEGTMLIDARLVSNPARLRFTEIHEAAHWIMHRRFYTGIPLDYEFRKAGCSFVADDKDPGERSKKNPRLARTDREWAEWQADTFAGALLMPKSIFVPCAKELLCDAGYKELRLVSGVDVENGVKVVGQLADIFQVSKRSVRIRMREFGMYVDA